MKFISNTILFGALLVPLGLVASLLVFLVGGGLQELGFSALLNFSNHIASQDLWVRISYLVILGGGMHLILDKKSPN